MIETVRFRNYKILRDVTIDLRPLTVFVGPNSSGKTTILKGLSEVTEDAAANRPMRRDEISFIQIEGRWLDRRRIHRLALGNPLPERIRQISFEDEIAPPVIFPPIRLEFDPARLACPAYSPELKPSLHVDGYGLSVVLADMKLNRQSDLDWILQRLKEIVPSYENLRFERKEVITGTGGDPAGHSPQGESERHIGFELLFDMHGASGVLARDVSQGTLISLGILTVLSLKDYRNLVLIDDLDHGLHPKALGVLVGHLHTLLEQHPELQIVATSHSPYLLDHLDFDEIRITGIQDDGSATVAKLTDHPEFERWKDLMAPGEFWSTVGEDWVTKSQPSEVPQ